MDITFPRVMQNFMNILSNCISSFILVSISTSWNFVIIIPAIFLFFLIQQIYIPVGRQLKKLDAIKGTSIIQKLQESIQGLCTIRAFNYVKEFTG